MEKNSPQHHFDGRKENNEEEQMRKEIADDFELPKFSVQYYIFHYGDAF